MPRATRLTFVGFDSTSKSAKLVNLEFHLKIAKRGMGLIAFVNNSLAGISNAGADILSSESLGFDFDLMIIYPPGVISSLRINQLPQNLTIPKSDAYAPPSTGTIDIMLWFAPIPSGPSE